MSPAKDDVLVTQLLGCGVLPDGTIAEMTLENSDGRIQVLRFSPTTMLAFVNSVFELFLNEKMQKEQAFGHFEMQPLPVSTTMAIPAVGGEAVLVGFRLENGLPVAFAVPPPEAKELHKQLGEAVSKAMQQFSQSRH
jgi:hypothetical protein